MTERRSKERADSSVCDYEQHLNYCKHAVAIIVSYKLL